MITTNYLSTIPPELTAARPESARRGPKARLSRMHVIAEASALLEEITLDEFTLAKLAKRLSAGVMSIYTYFPSRDALLDAVAEDLFGSFDASAIRGASWQDTVLQRLWATQSLIHQHPVVTKVIFWDGHHSPSWLKRWWLPTAQLLLDNGFDNRRTAFAMRWFSTAAMGLIISQRESVQRSQSSVVDKLEALTWQEQQLADTLWDSLRHIELRAVFEFGFRNLIQGLEALLQDDAVQEGQ